jgi:hypothetical protein
MEAFMSTQNIPAQQKPQARYVETHGCFNAATTRIIRPGITPANSNTR